MFEVSRASEGRSGENIATLHESELTDSMFSQALLNKTVRRIGTFGDLRQGAIHVQDVRPRPGRAKS